MPNQPEAPYREGSDAIKLKTDFATAIKEAQIKYRNRELLFHALLLAPIGAFYGLAKFEDNLQKLLPSVLILTMAVRVAFVVSEMRALKGLMPIQDRITATKNAAGVDNVVKEEIQAAWKPGEYGLPVMLGNVMSTFLLTCGVGMMQSGSLNAFLTALTGLIASIGIYITGDDLEKVNEEFTKRMNDILPHIGKEPETSKRHFALTEVVKEPLSGVRAEPELVVERPIADFEGDEERERRRRQQG